MMRADMGVAAFGFLALLVASVVVHALRHRLSRARSMSVLQVSPTDPVPEFDYKRAVHSLAEPLHVDSMSTEQIKAVQWIRTTNRHIALRFLKDAEVMFHVDNLIRPGWKLLEYRSSPAPLRSIFTFHQQPRIPKVVIEEVASFGNLKHIFINYSSSATWGDLIEALIRHGLLDPRILEKQAPSEVPSHRFVDRVRTAA